MVRCELPVEAAEEAVVIREVGDSVIVAGSAVAAVAPLDVSGVSVGLSAEVEAVCSGFFSVSLGADFAGVGSGDGISSGCASSSSGAEGGDISEPSPASLPSGPTSRGVPAR